jgi:hypothetical protein
MRLGNLLFPWSSLLTNIKMFCSHKMWRSLLIPRHMFRVGICPFLVRKYVFLFPKKDTLLHSNFSHPSDSRWEENIAIFWADDWPWFTVTSYVVHWHVIQWNTIWISDPMSVNFFQIYPIPPQMSEHISATICCHSCPFLLVRFPKKCLLYPCEQI